MTEIAPVAFLLDVDNTLLDNDLILTDRSRAYLTRTLGYERQQRYWRIFESWRAELGYADYLGALQQRRPWGAGGSFTHHQPPPAHRSRGPRARALTRARRPGMPTRSPALLLCRNTARMLAEARLARYLEVTPPVRHFGLFDCGPSARPAPGGGPAPAGACC